MQSSIAARIHLALLSLLVAATVLAGCNMGPATPTPMTRSLRYPYNYPTSIAFDNADVEAAWAEWKRDHITGRRAGPAPRLRVMGGVDFDSTVSEGQAYGILFASIFDEQATLDSLWLFAADHLDDQGLMHWHIGDYRQLQGTGAATDGDEDMAIGMVNACVKSRRGIWPGSPHGLDYCAIAATLIDAIWRHEIDHPDSAATGLPNNKGYELLPGDQWRPAADYPDGIVNLSYFAPGYYRVFTDFTANPGWLKVVERNYAIAALAQGKPGNCSGLVPNWNTYDGDPQTVAWQGEASAYWGYDAARFAWRIAVERYWYETPQAAETLNRVGGFFASIGIADIKGQYRLDGTAQGDARNAFFTANAAAAIWAAPAPEGANCGQARGGGKTTHQQAWDAVLATREPGPPSNATYYGNAWRLLSMLLMSGNFPNMLRAQPVE